MSDKRKIKVLVVDDEKAVRDFLSQLLALKGIETKTAEDGFKAIEAVKKDKFDVVFLDIRMPGIDGLETFRELKKISPDTRYVMITGYAMDVVLEQAKKEGALAWIKKPFEINEVISVITDGHKEKHPKNKLRILIVDDEEVVLNFFRRLLKEEIYDVTTVKKGREAIEQIKQKEFDLLFLDILLGDMNGIDLCLTARKLRPQLDIILITGDPAQAHIENLDIKGCFCKPFDLQQIFAQIDKVKRAKGL